MTKAFDHTYKLKEEWFVLIHFYIPFLMLMHLPFSFSCYRRARRNRLAQSGLVNGNKKTSSFSFFHCFVILIILGVQEMTACAQGRLDFA